jgi:hypothetical protein
MLRFAFNDDFSRIQIKELKSFRYFQIPSPFGEGKG